MSFEKTAFRKDKKWLIVAALIIIFVALAILAWQLYKNHRQNNLYSSNGRIEGTEIDIASRMGQRIVDILVREGDFVEAGQTLVYMETNVLESELKEAEAKSRQAAGLIDVSEKELLQKQSEKKAAEAQLNKNEAELVVAEKTWIRSSRLAPEGGASQQEFDNDEARYKRTLAARNEAKAKVEFADAAIATMQAQIMVAEAMAAASKAATERVRVNIQDSTLTSPREGRVQYLVAQIGEVVPSGGRILRILDLADIYMTFFLPTDLVGRIPIGAEARIILDAFPNYVIPAYISFISDVAQFTPKSVETKSEREKLMFRVRAQVPVDFLKKHINQVKTGLPGVTYLRKDKNKPWPAHLEYRVGQ